MWYFSWILGAGLAMAFGILNAIWYEMIEQQRSGRTPEDSQGLPPE